MVSIKSQRELELMRHAGKVLAEVHEELHNIIRPGISTMEINQFADKLIRKHGCTPSFLHLYDFPASICISINEEVVHGIPNKRRLLKEGDIVSLDAGVCYKGYHSDAARTWGVGQISEEAQRLIDVTREAFFKGIAKAVAGNHLNDICSTIGNYAEGHGYGVVEDLVGHGIGTQVHEEPEIPNFPMNHKGIKLCAGMTLAIEPMINQGTWEVEWLDDEWTVVTADRKLSAHYENTILVTDGEPEILSL